MADIEILEHRKAQLEVEYTKLATEWTKARDTYSMNLSTIGNQIRKINSAIYLIKHPGGND
jgi:hypothetical protein